MTDKTLNFTPELYEYFQRVSLRESQVLKDLRIITHKMSMSQMQISPEQGQFMAFLVELMGAKKTLDIGVFTGYSAMVVAQALPEDGKVIACDINVEWTRMAKQYWEKGEVLHKIELRLQPAVDTLRALLDEGQGGTFDFVFVDADKANYAVYYELGLELLRVGGVMAVDNVLWSGRVADLGVVDEKTRVIREFNEKVLGDERVSLSMVPLGDGVTVVRKR